MIGGRNDAGRGEECRSGDEQDLFAVFLSLGQVPTYL